MTTINRRTVLKGAAAAGIAAFAGPFSGFVNSPTALAKPDFRNLRAVPDLRDDLVRLWVPEGFQYRSFHDTATPGGITLTDGTRLPGRHDGMAAFPGPNGNVILVRNHEVNNPGAPFGDATQAYDAQARGGTTTVEVTNFGEVVRAFTSLNGTQNNCAGGRTPWNSWITCEETVNGPDVGHDFQAPPGTNALLTQRHGFIFEVPAGGQSNREPITAAGRFAHEAIAVDPATGYVYLTEDNFGFPSGFYRYIAPQNPMDVGRLLDGGVLQMLAVRGQPNANLAASQRRRATYQVEWVDIEDPNPTFAYTPGVEAPTSNDDAINYVGNQGREKGAAYFSRLEGTYYADGVIYFTSTQGGGTAEGPDPVGGFGNGSGQVWAYRLDEQVLQLIYESPGPDVLDLPDNITVSNKGTLVLCEDNVNDNYIRGMNPGGQLFDLVLNRLPNRTNDEFAGATFSPDGHTLFVNIQASAGMTFAIWGPWDRVRV